MGIIYNKSVMTPGNAYKGAREKQHKAASMHYVSYGNMSGNVRREKIREGDALRT